MGREKGLLVLQGKTFMEHIIAAMTPLVDDILIITSNPDYSRFGKPCIEDIYPDSGPLGGVYTGLMHSNTHENLVLSCDIPLIRTDQLKSLTRMTPPDDINVVQLGRDQHKTKLPLVARYRKSCLTQFEALLQARELRLQHALSKVKTLTLYKTAEFWGEVQDINTPWQLADLQKKNT